MTMRSIIAEDAHSGPHPRADRVAAATFEQMKAALIFLSGFSPDAFDYAMDAAESEGDAPGAAEEAQPVCGVCGGSIGVFLELGAEWQHFAGDGITAGEQQIYDPGHAPAVNWSMSKDLQTQL